MKPFSLKVRMAAAQILSLQGALSANAWPGVCHATASAFAERDAPNVECCGKTAFEWRIVNQDWTEVVDLLSKILRTSDATWRGAGISGLRPMALEHRRIPVFIIAAAAAKKHNAMKGS